MKTMDYVEFEHGDKVIIHSDFYEKWDIRRGDILVVDYQDGTEDVKTNKGWVDANILELVRE